MCWKPAAETDLTDGYPNGLYSGEMQAVAETPTFSRQTARIFSEDEKREVIDFLSENPLARIIHEGS